MTIAIGISIYAAFVAIVLVFNKGAARNEREQKRIDVEVDAAAVPQVA